jgi:TPR repeat protein
MTVDEMYNLGLNLCRGDGVRQDRAAGAALLEQAARYGDVEAMFAAGGAYAGSLGNGSPLNWTKAAYWTIQAAERGYAPAFHNAAVCFEDGLGGTPRNHGKAMAYYRLAAINGDPKAQQCLRDLGNG